MIRNTFLNIDAELYNNRKIESLLIFVYLKKKKSSKIVLQYIILGTIINEQNT